MNPSQAMLTLCQKFLDQHQGEERYRLMDEIAYQINGQPGMPDPHPTTAKELEWKVDGLLDSADKSEKVQKWLQQMDQFDLDGETLESITAIEDCWEDINAEENPSSDLQATSTLDPRLNVIKQYWLDRLGELAEQAEDPNINYAELKMAFQIVVAEHMKEKK